MVCSGRPVVRNRDAMPAPQGACSGRDQATLCVTSVRPCPAKSPTVCQIGQRRCVCRQRRRRARHLPVACQQNCPINGIRSAGRSWIRNSLGDVACCLKRLFLCYRQSHGNVFMARASWIARADSPLVPDCLCPCVAARERDPLAAGIPGDGLHLFNLDDLTGVLGPSVQGDECVDRCAAVLATCGWR